MKHFFLSLLAIVQIIAGAIIIVPHIIHSVSAGITFDHAPTGWHNYPPVVKLSVSPPAPPNPPGNNRDSH